MSVETTIGTGKNVIMNGKIHSAQAHHINFSLQETVLMPAAAKSEIYFIQQKLRQMTQLSIHPSCVSFCVFP